MKIRNMVTVISFAIFFSICVRPAHAQQPVYDTPCSAGTSVLNTPYAAQTVNPSNGHLKAYLCVDSSGNVTSPQIASFSGGTIVDAGSSTAYLKGMQSGVCLGTKAGVTNGSNAITCSANPWTSANNGQRVWATCCGLTGFTSHVGSIIVLPLGYITVTGAGTANVFTTPNGSTPRNATGSCSANAGCVLIWGPDASAGLTAAGTAAFGTAGACGAILLPPGYYQTTTGQWNSTVCATLMTGTASTYAGVTGIGISPGAGSILVIPPDFNPATCTGSSGSCFGGVNGMQLNAFTIWGAEDGTAAEVTTGTIYLLQTNIDTTWENISLVGWGTNNTHIGGAVFNGGFHLISNLVVDGVGGDGVSACTSNGSNDNVYSIFCGDVKGSGVTAGTLQVNGNLTTYRSAFGPVTTSESNTKVSGQWASHDDYWFAQPVGGGCAMATVGAAVVYLYNPNMSANTNSFSTAVCGNSNGAKVYIQGGALAHGTSGFDIYTTGSTGKVFLSSPPPTFSVTSGTVIQNAISEAGTGTCATNAATITFANSYANAPVVQVTDYVSGNTAGLNGAPTTTAATVHCSGASDAFGYEVAANPN